MNHIMDTLAARELANELRKQNIDIWDAGLGQNNMLPPADLTQLLKKYAHKKEYTSLHGVDGLSHALARYNAPWDTFVFGNGVKELLFIAQMAFQGTIIHITPSWVSYYKQMALFGKVPFEIHTTFESNWKVLPGQLEDCFDNIVGPKMLLFNNPNNPTGVAYTADETAIIGKLCKKYDVLVLSDEIYSNLVFDDSFVSIGVHTKSVRASSLSKDIGCGGYKLGWLAFTPDSFDFMQSIKKFATSIYSAPSAPIQYAFRDFLMLGSVYGAYCMKTRLLYAEKCSYVCKELSKTKLLFVPSQSAWYIFVSFRNYISCLSRLNIVDSITLSNYLANSLNIITVPGASFRCFDEMAVRFSIVDFDGYIAGCDRLIRWLETLKNLN